MWDWLTRWRRRWIQALICAIRRAMAPAEVSYFRSECVYGGTAAYRIIEIHKEGCFLRISVRIRLNPDDDVTAEEIASLRAIWEPGIENRWSNRFTIGRTGGDCACASYPVTFDVQFVDSGEHHTVRVRRGPARSNMTTWDTEDIEHTAAHEFGHMLGFADEYADEDCPDRLVATDDSVMRVNTGTPMNRHYQPFAVWLSNRACCDYAVIDAVG